MTASCLPRFRKMMCRGSVAACVHWFATACSFYICYLIYDSAGLGSQQWGRKKAAAAAVVVLAKSGAEALPPHAPTLAAALLAELPGRLWDGKETLLEALAALATAAPAALAPPDGPGEAAVVDALLAAAARRKAAYRAAALAALEVALGGLPGDHYAAAAPLLLDAVAKHAAALGAPSAASPAQVG